MIHPVDQVSLGAIVQVRDRLLEQQARGRQVLRLESGDPSFDIPPHVREAMEKALRDGLTHYTASTGIPQLRDAICRKVTAQNQLTVRDADHVIVTNGGMHGLYVLFRALLNPGDQVILPDPMWTEIGENIRLSGGVPVPVRLRAERGYAYSPEDIASAITPRTRAIFVNTPHNPTGAVAALNGPQEATRAMAVEYQLRRDTLYDALVNAPYVAPFKPSGTFYLWCKMKPDWVGYGGKQDDWSMTNYLIDTAGIGSSPGTAFGVAGEAHIRFAFSCSTAMVAQGASLLPEALRKA